MGALSTLILAGGVVGVSSAAANQYKALLTGDVSLNSPPFESVPASSVWQQQAWTAPSGTQFAGFAYTAATFDSDNGDPTGGLSVGFKGSGGDAPTDLNFPWTQDCSITEANSPREWVINDVAVGLTPPATNACDTSGSPTGWNLTNSEIASTGPGVHPGTDYQTLTLSIWCARNAACNDTDTASTDVQNLSGLFDDSDNQPSGGGSWTSAISASAWYQTDSDAPALSASASDPAGVCALGVSFSGPSNSYEQLTNDNPGMENPGGPIGNEFDTLQPCGGGSATGTASMPAGIASGQYNVGVVASNPGNWLDGLALSNAPTVASYSDAINIDDTVPTGSWENPSGGWTASTSEMLDVAVGPSGLASVTCTDNGSSVAPTLVAGSTAGAGTTEWRVPTPANGADAVVCSIVNGDANGPLTGGMSGTFHVDVVVPTVAFTDAGYAAGTWAGASQTVAVSATGGPSGMQGLTCKVDGNSAALVGDSNQVTITANGRHVLDCTATSNTNITGENTYDVDIDTEQPTFTFLVNGAAPDNTWLGGAPVVTVIGGESGGLLSGLKQITCSIDGGSPFTLSGVDAASDYTGSFELQQNGADQVSCKGTTVAGTTQGTASTVSVNVDNPNYSPNPSGLIDNGNDPFSDGPSQSRWYTTPQPVTITADDTGGPAPISSISCKGAVTGTWPLSNLNTDARGGEQITVTVPAPGGDLSCTADDSAGNVYALGSYLFQIDDTPPTGYFVPQGSWPQPDEIEIHATDGHGSGVAVVKVYGESPTVDEGQPQLVGDAQYDPSSGNYVVTIPDGVSPWVAGNWKFYANVIDVAGNQGQITAGPGGSTEDLTLPLREDTSVTAAAQRVTAAPEPAIPPALAATALGTASPGPNVAQVSAASRPVASIARVKARTPTGHVLTVRYGKKVTITGVLKDTAQRGRPIVGAKILVYQVVAGAKRYTKLGSAKTNAKGKYTYRVRAGASRTLYVLYPGTSVLRSAASDLQEKFAGKLSFSASRIPAGGRLLVTGAVKGGHIPPGGLSVTIDYRQVGAPGSGTLGTVRTDSRGRYRFTQHFAPSTRGLAYELWAVVPGKQPKWPYLKASTARLTRRVS